MAQIVTFETKHGVINIEVDDATLEAGTVLGNLEEFTPKGDQNEKTVVTKAHLKFSESLTGLVAFAEGVREALTGLNSPPQEVSVELGLKLTGSMGFVVAKVDASSTARVTLKWSDSM